MGSGKTFAGKQLASLLHYSFIDMDSHIEATCGTTISNIFSEKGEQYFRNLEKETLQELLPLENVVISTGGGVPCFFDNMEIMNAHGITLYLKTPLILLFDRLKKEKANRPILANSSDEDLKLLILKKLAEREIFYNQAMVIYDQQNNDDNVGLLLVDLIKRKGQNELFH